MRDIEGGAMGQGPWGELVGEDSVGEERKVCKECAKSSATTIPLSYANFDGPRTELVKAGGSTRLGQNRPGGRFWSSRVDPERRRLAQGAEPAKLQRVTGTWVHQNFWTTLYSSFPARWT